MICVYFWHKSVPLNYAAACDILIQNPNNRLLIKKKKSLMLKTNTYRYFCSCFRFVSKLDAKGRFILTVA